MLIALVGIVLLFVLVALGLPIAFSLFIVGFAGLFWLHNFNLASSAITLIPIGAIQANEMATLALFVLMGSFTVMSDIAQDSYEVAYRWLGRLPGGLGLTTIGASAAFAACCGSSIAGAITMGKLAIPEMKKYNYSDRLACGTCAAGGLLASLIPPSGLMVLYGIAAGEAIGKLLIAGAFPGILVALFFMGGLILQAKLNPAAAPASGLRVTWKERLAGIPKLWGIIVIFSIIFFGIFTGVFTATEAAAWGCAAALILLLIRRKRKFRQAFLESLWDCAILNATIWFLILGAFVFSSFIIMAGLPRIVGEMIAVSGLSPLLVVFLMILIYIPFGMFIDTMAMLLITIPIFHPIILSLGFEGIWFGVIVVMMVEIGMLTPPYGINAFVISSIAPKVSLADIFKGSMIFALLQLLVVVLVILFPQIALWLPSKMF